MANLSDETGASMKYIGIDSCKTGWFYVALGDAGTWKVGVAPSIQDLVERFPDAYLVLVDIPIGLRDEGAQERLCDLEARKVLGPGRASSVFPVPCRRAVWASSYEEASRINQELTGKRLSKQSWAITPKIREVDELLRASEAYRGLVREVHPEVCFWALNGRRSMRHGKKSRAGFYERLGVLRGLYAGAEELVVKAVMDHVGWDAGRDDILDALAAAVTAKLGFGGLNTLPATPETDAKGLPMEMVYHAVIPRQPPDDGTQALGRGEGGAQCVPAHPRDRTPRAAG